jgi:hypothetical protein
MAHEVKFFVTMPADGPKLKKHAARAMSGDEG